MHNRSDRSISLENTVKFSFIADIDLLVSDHLIGLAVDFLHPLEALRAAVDLVIDYDDLREATMASCLQHLYHSVRADISCAACHQANFLLLLVSVSCSLYHTDNIGVF